MGVVFMVARILLIVSALAAAAFAAFPSGWPSSPLWEVSQGGETWQIPLVDFAPGDSAVSFGGTGRVFSSGGAWLDYQITMETAASDGGENLIGDLFLESESDNFTMWGGVWSPAWPIQWDAGSFHQAAPVPEPSSLLPLLLCLPALSRRRSLLRSVGR